MTALGILMICVAFAAVACHIRKAPWTEDK
jgi:hypothetical protein